MGVEIGSSDIAKTRHASGLGKGKKGGTRANTGKMRRNAPQGTCLEIRLVLVRAIGRSSNSGRQQVSETMTSTQSIIGRKTAGLHGLGMDGLIINLIGLNGIKGINGVRLTATAVVGVSRVQEQVGRRRLTPRKRRNDVEHGLRAWLRYLCDPENIASVSLRSTMASWDFRKEAPKKRKSSCQTAAIWPQQ